MKEKLLKVKKIIDEMLEKLDTKIKLEPKNLKINSDGWKKHTNENDQEYLENPEGDVWEYKGNQYFTWDGAMREAEKLGKRLPTDEEMDKLEKKDYGKVEYVGFRSANDPFYGLTVSTFFWSSTESDSNNSARICHLCSSYITVDRTIYDKVYGFSVRCVQE